LGNDVKQGSATGANIALSFIDVLACALGAVVLLFVVFAALQAPTIARPKSSQTFLRFEWKIKDDTAALLRLKIKPPNSAADEPRLASRNDAYYVDLADIRHQNGPIRCRLPGTRSHSLIGFDIAIGADGTRSAIDAVDQSLSKTANHSDTVFVFRLNRPAAGEWRIGLVYFDRADSALKRRDPLRVITDIGADSSARIDWSTGRIIPGAEASLEFGDILFAPTVTIGPSAVINDPALLAECKVDWVI
jgi:hypothetical protein